MPRPPSLFLRLTAPLVAWLLQRLLGPAPTLTPTSTPAGARKFAYAHAPARQPRILEGEWRRLGQDGRQDW